jgi:hypothetical protein
MAKFMKATFADVNDIEQSHCEIKHITYRFSEHSTSSSGKVFQHSPSKTSSSSVDISHVQQTREEDLTFPFCDVLEHPSGWKFHSFHRHILNEQENVLTVKRIKDLLAQEFPSFREQQKKITTYSTETVSVRENSLKEEALDESHTKDDDDHLEVNGYKLHLPPMLFGADLMLLSLPKNKGHLSMSSTDALYAWVAQVIVSTLYLF